MCQVWLREELVILHTNLLGKLSTKMGFIIFKCLRSFGMEGYAIWDCSVPGPLKGD